MIQFSSTIGSIEDEYEIAEKIGSGTYAEVFRAREKGGKKQHRAIKRILINPLEDICTEVQNLKLFRSDHIIEYYGYTIDANQLYITMNLCKGSLRDLLDLKYKFTESKVSDFLTQITSAMLLLDSKHIMHLDLKPENILYQRDGYYKICDFGCATFFESMSFVGNLNNHEFGTTNYISPEIFLGLEKVKKSSLDVWSIGTILYEIIYKKLPFPLDKKTGQVDKEQIENFFEGISEIQFGKTDFSNPIVGLLKQMLEADPIKRINWKGIKKYLIDVLGREECEFKDVSYAQDNFMKINVLFNSLAGKIQENLEEGIHQFWNDRRFELEKMAELIIVCNYLYGEKFKKLFSYKMEDKLERKKIRMFNYFHEQAKDEARKWAQTNKRPIPDLSKLKEKQFQLLKLANKILKYLRKIQGSKKWKSLNEIQTFCQDAESLPRTFFCKAEAFENSLKLN